MGSIPRDEAGTAAPGTRSPAASGAAPDALLPVPESEAQHLTPESLAVVPSPSRRLWIGLCIVLSIFVVFAVYATHEVRWLEQFQGNVVQRNRKASLQLLRLQSDIYLLAISLREMNESQSRYPIPEWEPEFNRLHRDMDDAIRLEAIYAVAMVAADDKRAQLGVA